MKLKRHLFTLTLLWFVATANLVWAQDWFSNDDQLNDLATMAPADSLLFLAADVTGILTESRILKLKNTLPQSSFARDFVEGTERRIGYPIENLSRVVGPRAFFSVNDGYGRPGIVVGIEVQDRVKALRLFRLLGAIPPATTLKPKRIGEVEFQVKRDAGYGFYGDYLVFSNSVPSMESVFAEKESLAQSTDFPNGTDTIMVKRGLIAFLRDPGKFERDFRDISHVLAGLGMREGNIFSNLLVLLKDDSSLAPALLSSGGEFTGKAAAFIPREWGFMVSFHLGYLQSFRHQLKVHDPKLSGRFEEEAQKVEAGLGITLDDLMKVSTGEVAISSNGFRMAPSLFFLTYDHSHDSLPYQLTVHISLKDQAGTKSLLRGAWRKLGLDFRTSYDEVTQVPKIELAYSIVGDQLIMSYGKSAVRTLRTSLALTPAQRLSSNPKVQAHVPQGSSVAAAYLDFRPVVQELNSVADLSPYQVLLGRKDLMDATLVLKTTKKGLKLTGTGGAPVAIMTGFGAGFWLMGMPSPVELKTEEY